MSRIFAYLIIIIGIAKTSKAQSLFDEIPTSAYLFLTKNLTFES